MSSTIRAGSAALFNQRRREEYVKQKERLLRRRQPVAIQLGPGARLFFAPGMWEQDLRANLLACSWRRVVDPVNADAFVVSDPGAPPKMLGFIAGLTGGLVVSNTYLTNPGQSCTVRYHRALRLPRYLWVSDACRARFHEPIAVLECLVRKESVANRWKLHTLEHMMKRRHTD